MPRHTSIQSLKRLVNHMSYHTLQYREIKFFLKGMYSDCAGQSACVFGLYTSAAIPVKSDQLPVAEKKIRTQWDMEKGSWKHTILTSHLSPSIKTDPVFTDQKGPHIFCRIAEPYFWTGFSSNVALFLEPRLNALRCGSTNLTGQGGCHGVTLVRYSLVFCHRKEENLFVALYDKSFLTHTKPPRTQRDGHFFGGLKKKPFVCFVSLCDKSLVAAIRVRNFRHFSSPQINRLRI